MAERVEPPTVTVWVTQPNPNSRGVQLSPELKDDNASRQSFQNHSASPSTATAGPLANESGFLVLNRNKNALVQQAQYQPDGARGLAEDREHSAWLYLRRNLNYMGDVDYMISKLRGAAGSSVGTGAVVVAKSNSNARKVALRYPSLGVVVGAYFSRWPSSLWWCTTVCMIAARVRTLTMTMMTIIGLKRKLDGEMYVLPVFHLKSSLIFLC